MSAKAEGPWRELRSELEAAGFRPSKTRGQNFLLDGNLAHAIALDAHVGPGDFVLEVGPGTGALSLPLAHLGVELFAIEIDACLARIVRRRLEGFAKARVIVADALDSKHALGQALSSAIPGDRPWHLVANLPYSISAPLISNLASQRFPPTSMTVLVQRELALRLIAGPLDSAYGSLSVKLAWVYERRMGRSVGRQPFWPRPRVESCLVHLHLRSEYPLDRVRQGLWIDTLFQQRRKQLGGLLAGLHSDRAVGRSLAGAALEASSIDPRSRPEDLAPEQLLALARALGEPGRS